MRWCEAVMWCEAVTLRRVSSKGSSVGRQHGAWCCGLDTKSFVASSKTLKKQTWWHKRAKGHSETRLCQFSFAQKFPTHIHPIIISQVFKFWVFDVESVQNHHPIIPVIPVHLLAPFESPAVDCFHPLRGYGSSDLDRCWSGKNVIIRLSYGETKHKKTRFCCLAGVILRGPESFWRDQDTTRWMVFFLQILCQICVAGSGIERISEESLGRDSMLVLNSWQGCTTQAVKRLILFCSVAVVQCRKTWFVWFTYCWWKKSCTSWYVRYLITYRVSCRISSTNRVCGPAKTNCPTKISMNESCTEPLLPLIWCLPGVVVDCSWQSKISFGHIASYIYIYIYNHIV